MFASIEEGNFVLAIVFLRLKTLVKNEIPRTHRSREIFYTSGASIFFVEHCILRSAVGMTHSLRSGL